MAQPDLKAELHTPKKFLPELSLKLLLAAAMFLAALFLFALIAHEAVFEKEDIFDSRIFHFLDAHTTPQFVEIMRVFTFFGSATFLFPAYIVLVSFFLIIKKPTTSLNIAILAITSTALMQVLKRVFQRHRPELPLIESLKTYSFPSGHALSSFIFCMVLVSLVWKARLKKTVKWLIAVLLILFSVTVGLSRLILKVHYPSDVIAGFCLGIVWVILSFWFFSMIERKQ